MKTILFVPAIKKMLDKIPTMHADAFVVDLEDSIKEDNKSSALDALVTFLKESSALSRSVFVRLNSDRIEREVSATIPYGICGYMIPKFEDPFHCAYDILKKLNKTIIALVETPKGVLNIEMIASADWVSAIAFGAEDLTSNIGMENTRELLLPVRSKLIIAAKAYSKPVYDTPSFILDNEEALRSEAEHSADLGFDGKLAIHPNQVPIIQQAFNRLDTDYIRSIIDTYESGESAVLRIDGKVYEKMHIAHLKRILKERG